MTTNTLAQKRRVAVFLLFSILAFQSPAEAQLTAFTYLGRLNDAAGPATGSYDLQFSLFDADAGGNSLAGALSYPATPVSNGLFTVAVDFGASWFDGSARWLEIAVRTNGGAAYNKLSPRQALTSAPYAIRAANAALASAVPAGAILGPMLAAGSVTAVKLAPGAVSQLSAPDGTHANAVSVNANGHVGVGTDTPQAPLHIIGHNGFPHLGVAAGNDAPFGAFMSLDATATTGGNDYLIFSTGGVAGEGQGKLVVKNQSTGAYALTADPLGNVGIGTTGPATRFHVASASPVNTFFDGSSGIGTWIALGNTAGGLQWNFISTGTNNGEGAGKLLMSPGPTLGGVYGSVVVLQPDGKVGIGTVNPTSALQVVGTVTATAFNTASDRNLKENFTNIDPRAVLDQVTALPLASWNFKGDPAATHLGPMAQDFHAAFSLGTDDRHIATVAADGVALAAIQGLNQKLTEELKRRDAENAELRRRLDTLEGTIRGRP